MLAQINVGALIAQVSLACITIFWLWMLIDAVTKQPSIASKILWALCILVFYLLGALIYFFVARKNTPKETRLVLGVILLSAIGALAWLVR